MARTSGRAFISYSSKDAAVAHQLAAELERDGIPVWIDNKNIKPGESIIDSISTAIESSDYLIIIVSGHSVQSRWVHNELDLALTISMEKEFPVIPIVINKTPIPAKIKSLKYIDASSGLKPAYEKLRSFFRKEERLPLDERRGPNHQGKSPNGNGSCEAHLKNLSHSDLRRKILSIYNRDELEVLWNDLFGTVLQDDYPARPNANTVIELIDRCKRRKLLDELIQKLCEEHPEIID